MKKFTLYGSNNKPYNYTLDGIIQLISCGAKLLYLAKNKYKIIWS